MVLRNILLQKRAEILHLFVSMGVLVAILNLTSPEMSPEDTPILFAMDFEKTLTIPSTMQNFKKLVTKNCYEFPPRYHGLRIILLIN